MGVNYGRLAGFIFALCCCMAVISIVNIAFATTRTEAMYGTLSGGKVAYKSAAQMRLDKMHTYSFQQVPDQVARYVPKNKTFTPSYTSGQLAGMVKGIGKNTLGWAAVAGAVASAGWAIDELTRQVTKTTMEPDPDYMESSPGYYWQYTSIPGLSITNSYSPTCLSGSRVWTVYNGKAWCKIGSTYTGELLHSPCSQSSFCSTTPRPSAPLLPVSSPVSDSEFSDEVLPKFLGLPNSQIEAALNNPNGSPNITPQLSDMLRDWLQDVADRSPDLSFNPSTGSLTYTDPNTGESTELETAQPDYTQDGTESFTDVPGTDWPAACEWFPKLCEWIDWTQEFEEPEPQEMPFEEINLADIQEDFDSGLGSGSCPAPQTAVFMGETITYSFETACMASETYFKPILLTMAAIMAGFIIVGATRKGV